MYGFVEGDSAASALVVRLRARMGKYAQVFSSRFNDGGALIRRAGGPERSTEDTEGALSGGRRRSGAETN